MTTTFTSSDIGRKVFNGPDFYATLEDVDGDTIIVRDTFDGECLLMEHVGGGRYALMAADSDSRLGITR